MAWSIAKIERRGQIITLWARRPAEPAVGTLGADGKYYDERRFMFRTTDPRFIGLTRAQTLDVMKADVAAQLAADNPAAVAPDEVLPGAGDAL